MTQQTTFGDESWGFEGTVEGATEDVPMGEAPCGEPTVEQPSQEEAADGAPAQDTHEGGAGSGESVSAVTSAISDTTYIQRTPRPADWPGMPLKCIECELEYRTTVPCCPGCGHRWDNMLDYRPEDIK